MGGNRRPEAESRSPKSEDRSRVAAFEYYWHEARWITSGDPLALAAIAVVVVNGEPGLPRPHPWSLPHGGPPNSLPTSPFELPPSAFELRTSAMKPRPLHDSSTLR